MPLSVWSTTTAPNDSPSRPCSTAASVASAQARSAARARRSESRISSARSGQCRAHGIRHVGAATGGLAHDETEAVDEAAQRRGDVGVGRGDRGVLGLAGHLPVEGRVAGAAEERRRLVDEGEVPRVGAVQASGRTRRRALPPATRHPGHGPPGGTRRPPRAWAAGMVRSTPTPASSIIVAAAIPVSSETCAFHSSAGDRRPELEGEAPAVARGHLLLGHRQARATAGPLLRDATLADLLEQQEALVVGAGVERRLHLGVVEPLDAAHHRAVHLADVEQSRRRRGAGPRRRRAARHPAAGSRRPRRAPRGAAAPARRGSRRSGRARG